MKLIRDSYLCAAVDLFQDLQNHRSASSAVKSDLQPAFPFYFLFFFTLRAHFSRFLCSLEADGGVISDHMFCQRVIHSLFHFLGTLGEVWCSNLRRLRSWKCLHICLATESCNLLRPERLIGTWWMWKQRIIFLPNADLQWPDNHIWGHSF